tara:strand:+ start:62 stop:262 length:201 start_codon:yes stop_codon:yes gene_type:complete
LKKAREMKSLNVRTSAEELEAYARQSKKERKVFEKEMRSKDCPEVKKKFNFSNWVRWKLLKGVDNA